MSATADSHVETGSIDRLTEAMRAFVRALHALKTCAPDATANRSSLLLLPHLEDGGCRLRALAEAVHADPSTVSRQVSELVDLGLVRREADPKDGRATLLTITSAGRGACDDLRRRRRFLLAELLAEWPDERIDALTDLLRSFSSAVEVRAKDDGALRRTLREVPSVTNGAGDGASLSSALSSEETA